MKISELILVQAVTMLRLIALEKIPLLCALAREYVGEPCDEYLFI